MRLDSSSRVSSSTLDMAPTQRRVCAARPVRAPKTPVCLDCSFNRPKPHTAQFPPPCANLTPLSNVDIIITNDCAATIYDPKCAAKQQNSQSRKEIAMCDVLDVSDYILVLGTRFKGGPDPISPLKLQKLLYYFQGVHIADCNETLYKNRIVAWAHGPVVRSVWDVFKSYGSSPIPPPRKLDETRLFTSYQRDIMEKVYIHFGQYTAWKLRNMTHVEPPWQQAWEQGQGTEITFDSLKVHFLPRLKSILGR